MNNELETQKLRLLSGQVQFDKFKSLADQQYFSDAALQLKRDELLDQQSRHQVLERSITERKRALSSLKADLNQSQIRAEREGAAIDRSLLELDEASISTEAQREIVITAPQTGTVTTIQGEVGQVTNGQPLLAILPEGAQLQAHLFAPSSAVGFVMPGQNVRLRYAAYPYQKFGQYEGKVVGLSKVPFGAQELPANLGSGVIAAAQAGEGLYRITVTLNEQVVMAYGKAQLLTPGMQLEADVMQDTRRLIEWLLEPVFSLRGKS